MGSNKLGQDSAFPKPYVNDPHLAITTTPGMSKRFYAACAAVSGIMANSNAIPFHDVHFKSIVEDAYKIADELLKQEDL